MNPLSHLRSAAVFLCAAALVAASASRMLIQPVQQ